MSLKTGIIAAALTAAGLFAAAPAQAQAQAYGYRRAPAVFRNSFAPRYAPYRYGRWMHRRYTVRPVYQVPSYSYVQPSYSYVGPVVPQPAYDYDSQPSYPQPVYSDDSGAFAEHVRVELANIENAVHDRVAAGQLDGDALTAMESARNDIEQDVTDVSAKGYISPADRAHIEQDVQKLRERFGC